MTGWPTLSCKIALGSHGWIVKINIFPIFKLLSDGARNGATWPNYFETCRRTRQKTLYSIFFTLFFPLIIQWQITLYLLTTYAWAEMWKTEKWGLKYVQPKSVKQISGFAYLTFESFNYFESREFWILHVGNLKEIFCFCVAYEKIIFESEFLKNRNVLYRTHEWDLWLLKVV